MTICYLRLAQMCLHGLVHSNSFPYRLQACWRFSQQRTTFCGLTRPIKPRIALKDRSTTVSQLKAWSHALRVAQACSEATTRKVNLDAQATLMILRDTLRVHNETFDKYFKRLEDAGWNTLIAALETKFGRRIRVEEHKMSVQS